MISICRGSVPDFKSTEHVRLKKAIWCRKQRESMVTSSVTASSPHNRTDFLTQVRNKKQQKHSILCKVFLNPANSSTSLCLTESQRALADSNLIKASPLEQQHLRDKLFIIAQQKLRLINPRKLLVFPPLVTNVPKLSHSHH